MKYFVFSLSLFFTCGLVLLLNAPQSVSGTSIPPLGKFLSPFVGFWQNAETGTKGSQNFNYSELENEVVIAYDERMVPHIFAENFNDAFFVQGYVTARDRLWQMDISTRSASGRLAEVLGERLLSYDKEQRRVGLMQAAEKMLKSWQKDKESMNKLESYVAGVNAYVNQLKPKDYPIEFKLLNYKPEPWSVLKIAQFGKSMERALNSREYDMEHTNLLKNLGPVAYQYLYPERNPKESPIIPDTVVWDGKKENQVLPQILPDLGSSELNKGYPQKESSSDFIGSNNWAVSGSKTQSGNPILCNDPHLQMTLPAIWYEVQLKTPEHNVYGVSFPGLPGVVIGFNEHIAWGSTNGAHDVKDWYKIRWADDKKKTYLLDGKPEAVTEVVEEIKIAGQPSVFDTVKYTKWGPIPFENEDSPYRDMAVKWIANDTGDDFIWKTFWSFNTARNYEDFITATNHYGHPNQNFVFASKEGDIGMKVSGLVPEKGGNGRFIQDGSDNSNDWQGFIPQSEMPQEKNPERGFVSSANQNPVGEAYPYAIPGNYNHYRGRIINRKLEVMNDITREDMCKMQNDNYSILPEEMLPILLKNLDESRLNTVQKGLVGILNDWDYIFDKEAIAPVLFEEWRLQLRKLIWDEPAMNRDKMLTKLPSDWRLIEIMETDPINEFFDNLSTPEKETVREIVTQSFLKMNEHLRERLEDKDFSWDEYKGTDFMHLARLDAFSRKDKSIGGYREAINAVQSTAGPSWRMVVELGDEPKAKGIFPGGQSGNPGSKYYDNTLGDFCDGRYYELFFMKDKTDRRQTILFESRFN